VLHANVNASAANPNVAPAACFHRFVNPMALMSSPFARTVLGASRAACHDLLQGGCQASRAPISSIFGQNSLTLARSQVWCCPQNGSTGGLNVRHVLRATVLRCNVQIRATSDVPVPRARRAAPRARHGARAPGTLHGARRTSDVARARRTQHVARCARST